MKHLLPGILLLFCLYLLLVQSSCGLYYALEKFGKVETTASVHESKINGQNNSYIDPLGFHIGMGLKLAELNQKLSIHSEMNVSFQGAKYDEGTFTGRLNLLYLNMPTVIRYDATRRIFVETGIQPGFLLRARDKYNGYSDNYRSYLNPFDLGIPVGAGLHINKNLDAGLRIIQGVTNINKDDPQKDHNLVIALRLTYLLGKK